jgi:toxin ParE1/3/4
MHVAPDNAAAADQIARRILDTAQRLATQPLTGRRGRRTGTRELAVPKTAYLLIYRIRPNAVQILRVLHHARKYP